MNVKLRILLAQFVVFLTLASPAFSFDEFMSADDEAPTPTVRTKPQPITLQKDQRIVPHSDGRPQGYEGFRFHFKGLEDSSAARVVARSSIRQYSWREKWAYFRRDEKPNLSVLSGTMTSHGVITNAHGFVEEVPCFQNDILNWLGKKGWFHSEKRYYRTLDPLRVEQGLTTEHFKSENANDYFDPDSLPDAVSLSAHAVYDSVDMDSVSLMQGYMVTLLQRRKGWFFGSINSEHDVALVKVKQNRYPEKVCQIADKLPHHNPSPLHKVTIYQYPNGHPLQKRSFEFADFSKRTHQCVTLGGSSGSAIRDFVTGQMIGVHQGGNAFHNQFIPFSSSMVALLNRKIYASPDELNKKD